MQIGAGSARSDDDTDDLVLAANTTLDITVIGVGGVDAKTSAATAATHATTTFEPSASIVAELGTRIPTFTSFSTVTTTMTGVGTKFLSEVAVNDLIGNNVKGYAQVTAITSDTVLTLAAALPGGDAGGGSVALVVIENPTCKVGATITDARQIKTLSAAGTSVVVTGAALASNTPGGGVVLKLGVVTGSVWFFPWLVKGGSGTSVILSTQRTKPYNPAGYTTTQRRIPCAILDDSTLNGGTSIRQFVCAGGGPKRRTYWTDLYLSAPANRILSSTAPATAYTTIAGTFGAPPTAIAALLSFAFSAVTSAAAADNFFHARITGTTPSLSMPLPAVFIRVPATAGTPVGSATSGGEFPWSSASVLDYLVGSAFTAGTGSVDVFGWEESA